MKHNPTYEECAEKLEKIYSELEKIENFYFADVGYKIVNGEATDEFAIRIFLHGPKLEEEGDLVKFIPLRYGNIKTDILPTFEPLNGCPIQPETNRIVEINPIIGGISIGPYGDISTLGIICESERYGLCALTTFHGKYRGKIIYQPSPQEGTQSFRPIGKLVSHVSELDISLLKIENNIDLYSNLMNLQTPSRIASWSTVVRIFKEKSIIYKSGRSTGVTRGKISGIRKESQQITIRSKRGEVLSCRGDSGAIWVTEDGEIIGVHTKGKISNNDISFALCYSLNKLVRHWGLSLKHQSA
ncbi:MAG: hypothetical protein CMH46_11440 [Muricauda sp.]|nr:MULTISPECIES: trypsin-like serine protease [unclassified Allomuricauda]MAU16139.1 hypothetical protein [Allomuricauda sp.]|tara:strand:- start:7586 stop:8485 length:900 start_codon:yes stop_codon:yes gene_type:complete